MYISAIVGVCVFEQGRPGQAVLPSTQLPERKQRIPDVPEKEMQGPVSHIAR